MRVVILTVGSRGDVEPYVALARKIVTTQNDNDNDEPNQVDFFVQPELKSLVTTTTTNNNNNGAIRIHTWPFTQQDFYAFVGNPKYGVDHENPRVRFVGVVSDIIASLVLPSADTVQNVVKQQCSTTTTTRSSSSSQIILVTSTLARSLAMAVGTLHDIPVALVHLQPLVPTTLFPHYSQADECLDAILKITKSDIDDKLCLSTKDEYKDTYVTLERFQHQFLQERLDEVYQEFGLASGLSFEDNLDSLEGKNPKVGIFNCFSSELIPSVTKRGEKEESRFIYDIGAMGDSYVPSSFEPETLSDDLLQFLQRRPICVGYGSMPFDRLVFLLEALEAVGKPAVLVGKAMSLPRTSNTDWLAENIRQVDALPYAWLLPQCRMMLSHGGAGVLHATLRAGIPAVISPLMGDQLFWAQLVQAKGLGIQAGQSLPSVTKEDIQTAIQRAETECVDNARAFGQAMQNLPDGLHAMCHILKRAAKNKAFSDDSETPNVLGDP